LEIDFIGKKSAISWQILALCYLNTEANLKQLKKPSMLEHLYIQRMGDRESVLELYENLKKSSKAELVEAYNNAVRIGVVGDHAQGLHLIALNRSFHDAFQKSPIKIEENVLISLPGAIDLKDDNWEYQN